MSWRATTRDLAGKAWNFKYTPKGLLKTGGDAALGVAKWGVKTTVKGLTNGAALLASETTGFLAKIEIIKILAPMVQAMILMAMIMVLPWAWVLAGAQWSAVFALTVFFISVKFWTSLFTAANYLEHNLWSTMYPSVGARLSVWDAVRNPIENTVFLILVGLLYLVLPIVLSLVLTMAGWKAGSSLDNAAFGGDVDKLANVGRGLTK